MSFGLFIRIISILFCGLAILFLYPSAKIAVDGLIASWTIVVPDSLAAVIAILPLLLLGFIGVGLTWWLFGSGDG